MNYVLPSAADTIWTSPEVAVLARTRALCHRRILWLEHLAERAVQDPALQSMQTRILLDLDAPDAEAGFLEKLPQAQSLKAQADAAEAWLFESAPNRLNHLALALELSQEEQRLVQLCFAFAIDPTLGHLFGKLAGHDGPAGPTEVLAARLNAAGRAPMWGATSALGRWCILQDTPVGGSLHLDPFVLSYLWGGSAVDPELLNAGMVINAPPPALEGWPVAEVADRVISALRRGTPARIQIIGAPLSGRKTFAANLSEALGRPLFVVDTARIETGAWPRMRMLAQRQALLHDASIAWAGEHAVQGLDRMPGGIDVEFTILDTPEDLAPAVGWHEERVTIPALDSTRRKELWQRFLPAVQGWGAGKLDHLANRFRVSIGEIVHISAQGDDTFDGVQQRTRALSHCKLGDLAKLIKCPFKRADLYLPDQASKQLDDFLFEARERNTFWENPKARRLFPRGVGLIGLLSGPPGTGKTMAAQVIAEELGLDLFRIDMASTVDKYIGETAKQLRRLFARAGEMNAVLLFDEADALFSRRTDTKDSLDKHSNADTSYLLQLVEDYPGVALLATNKRQQIDDAFVRRIRYVFYLPRPDAPERAAIWQHVLAALASFDSAARLSGDIKRLAVEVPMSGAQIKNAALAAVFLAKRDQSEVSAVHLDVAIARQLVNQGGNLASNHGRQRS